MFIVKGTFQSEGRSGVAAKQTWILVVAMNSAVLSREVKLGEVAPATVKK